MWLLISSSIFADLSTQSTNPLSALPFHSAGSQDCKQKVHQICDLAAAVALRLKPETLGPPSLYPPRGPSQNAGPEISVSFAIEQDSRKKKNVLEAFVKSFHTNSNAPYLPWKECSCMGSTRSWQEPKGFSY